VNNIKEILISPNSSIIDALRIIASKAVKITLVVSPDGKFFVKRVYKQEITRF